MHKMMFSAAGDMQSALSTLFSAYASFAALMMLIRSMANELVPSPVRTYLQSLLRYFAPVSKQITIVVDEHYGGISRNQVYEAVEVYLGTKINPNTERFKVGKTPKQKSLNISVDKGIEIIDRFDNNIELKWRFASVEPRNQDGYRDEKCFFELSFNKKFKDRVMNEYLPFVLAQYKEIKDKDKVVKLYTRKRYHDSHGGWSSINLDHPATFETLAMDPQLKKGIKDDLESAEMQDRTATEQPNDPRKKLTLSGMLNFIDGLWSSCGDERIIIFTTNYKEKLDPALLRPGRMDMHIHMSYCTGQAFRLLASNYLDIHDHLLFGEIEDLMAKVEVTPAEVAEELMKSEDVDVALAGVVSFLKCKKTDGKEIEEDKANGPKVLQEENVLESARNKEVTLGGSLSEIVEEGLLEEEKVITH
ncbi:hypothetical protein Vadar_022637 [Vaccinium darrowii]|uniref:Uncharacterized protein n=1 Tax=Vaccinium darrowii TaxID=229202 RepID=A0ACB7YY19_9ERIC|nr:hypothetical protein Vadar_022637 [Vaccinium darrowii]